MRQAIILINDDLVYWLIYASLGLHGLTPNPNNVVILPTEVFVTAQTQF